MGDLVRQIKHRFSVSQGDSIDNAMEASHSTVENRLLSRKLIVGLGNPGNRHARNRHNIGFMCVDQLAERNEISLERKKHKTKFGTGQIFDNPVVVAKPQTYMNLSGDSVGRLKDFYNIDILDIIMVYDEIDLPLGTIRIREKGGSGGHNGVKSVIKRIGSEFPRIRLGVGRPPGRMDPADYVLQDFNSDDWPFVEEMIATGVKAIEMLIQQGIDKAMTKYNGKFDAGTAAGEPE